MNFFWQGSNSNIFSLHGDGNATLAGTLTQNSDSRLKTDIQPIDNALSGITQLSGYRYNWLDKNADQSTQIGVIAQDVQKIYPELVRADCKGILSVNYSGLVPVLINAIKEQNEKFNALASEVESLKKIIKK